MLGVNQRQNRVQQVAFGDFIVHEEGLSDRAWVSQPGGLDHNPVKVKLTLAPFLGEIAQGVAQIFADGAADAAIAHLDDLLFGASDQNFAIDIFLAELVLNHGNFLAMRLFKHAFEERGFARAKKARQDRCRYKTHRFAQ